MDFEKIATQLSGFVWGVPLIALLFGTHLFLTVRTGFIQRFLVRAIKLSFSRKKEGDGDVSQFGALMTALAATIGTGNIVGVSTAIVVGGPGAVLWMWLTGVFGIATKYSEALLAVKYRVQLPNGSFAGGPMYALERGLGQKWLGLLFAFFTMVAAFGIGCMTQANSVVANVNQLLSEKAATGVSWAQPHTVAWVLGILMARYEWSFTLITVGTLVVYVTYTIVVTNKRISLHIGDFRDQCFFRIRFKLDFFH